MKKSTIQFTIQLDKDQLPEKIEWSASDHLTGKVQETKCISVAVWDQDQANTLRIDLWTKDMPILNMKQFCVEVMAGLSQTIATSTGDQEMANEINKLCHDLAKRIASEV
jgi:gliding motility-associated protein GldC